MGSGDLGGGEMMGDMAGAPPAPMGDFSDAGRASPVLPSAARTLS